MWGINKFVVKLNYSALKYVCLNVFPVKSVSFIQEGRRAACTECVYLCN